MSLKHFAPVLLILVSTVSRSDPPSCCEGLSLDSAELRLLGCSDRNGVVLCTYVGSTDASPYATEFDRRTVVIACGAESPSLRAMIGVPLEEKDAGGYRTLLARPPEEEQVVRRTPDSSVQNYFGWQVYSERVDYGAQGGMSGYTIDCATAIKATERYTSAVSECFSVEKRNRFLQTLPQVRKAWTVTR